MPSTATGSVGAPELGPAAGSPARRRRRRVSGSSRLATRKSRASGSTASRNLQRNRHPRGYTCQLRRLTRISGYGGKTGTKVIGDRKGDRVIVRCAHGGRVTGYQGETSSRRGVETSLPPPTSRLRPVTL